VEFVAESLIKEKFASINEESSHQKKIISSFSHISIFLLPSNIDFIVETPG
jgi:hypothetical protein